MTWGQFKTRLESLGISDDTELFTIDVSPGSARAVQMEPVVPGDPRVVIFDPLTAHRR